MHYGVRPEEIQFVDVAQIHCVSAISVDFITLTKQIVERVVVGAAESQPEDASDARSRCQWPVALLCSRTRDYEVGRTIRSGRRCHRFAPRRRTSHDASAT